jgi:SanA protein
VGAVRLNDWFVSWSVRREMYHDVRKIPFREYCLVLGAGGYKPEQWVNHAFNERMEAARILYINGKTSRFILSGAQEPGVYSEPREMRDYLVAAGIPASALMLDTLGIRTWYSVQRARDVFQLRNLTIITQPAHSERAVFSARCMGIDALGFEAGYGNIHARYWKLRDRYARVKMLLDCIAFHLKNY